MNDEKEKMGGGGAGDRGPAFLPYARVSRDLFRYKYMYERKEFLKKENKRTNKRIS